MLNSKRRWVYPGMCFVITFLGGTLYSYSVIGYEIQKLWSVYSVEAGMPYFVSLGVYGYLMFLGGVLEKKFGSEKIPLYLGAMMFGLGFISSGFIDRNIALFTLSYLLAGFGLALMDSMTLPIATSWIPDKPGLAVGIARTGFGIASLVVAPLLEYMFKVYGFSTTLKFIGIAYLGVSLAIASFAKVNPEFRGRERYGDIGRDLIDILSSKCFWSVWLQYFTGLFTPLAYIGYVKQIGVEIVSIKPEVMGYLIAIFSIFNGIGRVVYGKLIDMKGFLFSAILNYLLTVFTSVTLWLYPSYTTFILTSIIIYLTLGGWMVIAPTEIRTVISSNKYSLTWPLLMTGYSTAVFVGTVIAGLIRDVTGSFKSLFIVSLFTTLVLGLIPIYMFYRKMCKH